MLVDALLAGCGLPRSEALLLLAHASGRSRERLIAGAEESLKPDLAMKFESLATRRAAGEPIAYLLGYREFYGRRFAVDARVLIPRPETELLVEQALHWIDARATTGAHHARVLDLGTGSGAIAATLALERPSLAITATDVGAEALQCAEANAARLGAAVRFAAGDWFDALDDHASFDLIVSNPPYIAANDRHLDEGDLRFEPRAALTEGGDGLAAIRRIVCGSPSRLAPGGALMVEHGYDQAARVRALLQAAGLVDVASVRDLAGIERVSFASLAGPGVPMPAAL